MALCECKGDVFFERIGRWDRCPLVSGHTSFAVNRCHTCGGVFGFPHGNLEIALKDGTDQVKKQLQEIIDENPAAPQQ